MASASDVWGDCMEELLKMGEANGMSLSKLYEVLSERFSSYAVRGVHAVDDEGDFTSDFRLSGVGSLETVREEQEKGRDYERGGFWRSIYRLKRAVDGGFHVFECVYESGGYDVFTGVYSYVRETFVWVIGDAEVYEEFHDLYGEPQRRRVECVRDPEVSRIVEEVERG